MHLKFRSNARHFFRRFVFTIILLAFGFESLTELVEGNWWYYSHVDPTSLYNHQRFCDFFVSNKLQKKICNKQQDIVKIVGHGVHNGITECQFQFRYQRWNCTTFINDPSLFGKQFMKGGTREVAFLQAIFSASAIVNLARTCSTGHPQCGCGSDMMIIKDSSSVSSISQSTNQSDLRRKYYQFQSSGQERFKWEGCDPSVKFATRFVRRFVNAAESSVVNHHNNRVGRLVVRETLSSVCKCHGLSGSCSMKTCWSRIPSLRVIGDALRSKYDSSVEVTFNPSGQMVPQQMRAKRPTKTNLIYYEPSPNYCQVNHAKGSVGTRARVCKISGDGEESCDILCCRGKFVSQKIHISDRCNCTFTWCCKVDCQICESTRIEYRCM